MIHAFRHCADRDEGGLFEAISATSASEAPS